MSNNIRLDCKYSKVLTEPALMPLFNLASYIPTIPKDGYIENNEQWVWAIVKDTYPPITKQFLLDFIGDYQGKLYWLNFFIAMPYEWLNSPVPAYLPNAIKTYTNLIGWEGLPNEVPSDLGEPIYKTWIEYFAGTDNQITCNTTQTTAYVTGNLWATQTADLAPIINNLIADGYTFLTDNEYKLIETNPI